jgi:hypothetical protein
MVWNKKAKARSKQLELEKELAVNKFGKKFMVNSTINLKYSV